jgi:putative membrane protein
MKAAAIAAWAVGAAAVIALIVWSGAASVGEAVESAGWGVVLVVVIRAVQAVAAGSAWWLLVSQGLRPSIWVFQLLRVVRDGVNSLLPSAQVGGDVVGARLLTFWRVEGGLATASVVVDVTLLALTQFLFAILGVVMLMVLVGSVPIARLTIWGLLLATVGLGALFFMQQRGGLGLLRSLAGRLIGGGKWGALGAIEAAYRWLGVLYRRRGGVAGAATVHLVIWFVGVIEVWVALHFMGYPVSYGQALVIESLVHALRGAAFLVPGALGIQEGGIIALCALFGIPIDAALALSLIKRIADVAVGVPGLVTWQALEGRHLWRLRQAAALRAGLGAGGTDEGTAA